MQVCANISRVESKITVQIAMQRLQVTTPPTEKLADSINPPVRDDVSKTDKVVPDSFSEWLAQPSQTIAAGSEPEQGIFMGLLDQCCTQGVEKLATLVRRH